MVKNSPANAGDTEMQVQSLGQEDPPEQEMANCSRILAWKIPWTEDNSLGGYCPGGHRELDMTELLRTAHTQLITMLCWFQVYSKVIQGVCVCVCVYSFSDSFP